ncbi:glycosyltransferase [Paenibacillus sp. NEAU-GSW1]|uniref:glycosyltransferase n=1 Tax=Paenibacillus sp. NEAU-GSW1 TaxID=2682486 RepID=UPI0012E2E03D|nr:glycosyltransferase [Paenibacillus sp. NEAU-GSW1]MUT66301.1 glycosyltransferase [Paenibacillus sp. NEAU-GSW1]
MVSIGVFWGYSFAASFDKEGIGRYFFRLIEGMLSKQVYQMKIAFQECNREEIVRVLQPLKDIYGDKLELIRFINVPELNMRAKVDLWIVPYVGLENALQLEKPYLLCLHDLVYRHPIMSDIYRSKHPEACAQLDRLAPLMCAKAVAVIFNSEYILQFDGLQGMGLPKWKTALIRTSAPVEEFQLFGLMTERALRQKYNLHQPYFLFPSAVRYHKNHDRLVQAFLNFLHSREGRRSNVQLVFTDLLHNHPMGVEIEKIIMSCGIVSYRNQIRFIGRIPSQDLPSLYRYAKGTIVPTLFEGNVPFPLLESLTMDTPLAVSRIPVTTELVKNLDHFIHFDPYSVTEMQEAISKLWQADESVVKRQQHELRDVLKRRWSDVATEYGNVISNVLNALK